MSVDLVIGIIFYIIIAVVYGFFINMLILSDIEILDILETDRDRYFTCALFGLFWVITFPILIFNTIFGNNDDEE